MFHNKQFILALVTFTILSSVFAVGYMASFTPQPARAQYESAATTTATPKSSGPTTDYRVYDNSTLGIKIEVPADWLYKEINNTAVTFVTNASSTPRVAVVVLIQNVPTNIPLDAFSQGCNKLPHLFI